jgi:hypothetical protein
MLHYVRVAAGIFLLLSIAPARADAQTLTLTIHVTGNAIGKVRVVAGGFGVCTQLTPTWCSAVLDTVHGFSSLSPGFPRNPAYWMVEISLPRIA